MSSPTTPPSGQPPPPNANREADKNFKADQEWIDRLSGKLTQAENAETLREADLLRAAILREHAVSAPTSPGDTDHNTDQVKSGDPTAFTSLDDQAGAERLMFALRREGLLPDPAQSVSSAELADTKRPAWMMPAALAASVLVGFFALQALQLGQVAVQYDEPPTMRGQIQQISLRDKNPRVQAESIVRRLKEAGLSARMYQSREQFVVDVDLVAEKFESASKTLNDLGLEAKPGLARITLRKMD